MASTTFVDGETLIEASWLNDVNAVVYTPGSTTAADIANVPAGNIAAVDVQTALNELDTEKQPLDTDLTAIAALTTATYGRSLLTVTDEANFKATVNLEVGVDIQAYNANIPTVAPGTAGNVLTSNGSAWTSTANLTAGTKVTASGTSVTFSSIPSWVKRIHVLFSRISTNGISPLQVQLGDAGGLETTGYASSAFRTNATAIANQSSSTGLLVDYCTSAALARSGVFTLCLVDANTWVSSTAIGTGTGETYSGAGSKTLSATLDRISIAAVNGTDAFAAGDINIIYD